ncbi:hypothetical protein QUF72_04270 [Desulfobacterales bacterium HSG2]|nr:hypothetical protein [Desulfobacterales bacterium HSG2]
MKESDFKGIQEGAFANCLKTRQYDGCVNNEIVTEKWYRLSFEDARRFLSDNEWVEHKIEQGQELANPWIKVIAREYKNRVTGETRRSCSSSLRPYVQGYGCDGSTDRNIHAIANRLAEQQGLDYPSLMMRAYPGDFSADDFSWLTDKIVLAETVIPEKIDADLALRDLEDINNYTLAMEFGIELHKLGVISTDWAEIREFQEQFKKQAERDVRDWFEKKYGG